VEQPGLVWYKLAMSAAQPSDPTARRPAQPSAKERFAHALSLVPELAEVEAVIRSCFHSDVTAMREIPEYLLSLGGKRIRPVLTLLCSKALGSAQISDDVLDVAAGIELIHMATLMHDDIIDQSPTRRHKPSPYAKFGTAATLLSGDFLLTRAFGLCAKLDDVIVGATEQACIELVEGEALESPLHVERHTTSSSLTIAKRKTASLFRLAAFCAAHLNGASREQQRLMGAFGESLGIAFQVIDDILDVTSDEATLGKRQGLDLFERKPSLVNVLWLESGDPVAERLLAPPLTEPSEQPWVESALKTLASGPVVAEAKRLARRYADDATKALTEALGGDLTALNPEGEALLAVVDFALERVL